MLLARLIVVLLFMYGQSGLHPNWRIGISCRSVDLLGQAMPKASIQTSSQERLREAAKSLFAKRGYEATSTAAICKMARTSQSQLVKHFSSKQGILQAIFEYAWDQINPAVSLAIEKIASPTAKLRITIDMVLSFLEKDRELRALFLLEARRVRGDGHMVVLVPGFLEFVKTLDSVLQEMALKAELSPRINPQALRSAMMGAVEGLLRDQMVARRSHFPAAYSDDEARVVFSTFLAACLNK